MEYIYIDVLIITNLYVNYFLIKSTARITHTAIRMRNCVLTALFGSVFALNILLPKGLFVISILIKLFGAFLVVRMAFGKNSLKKIIKLTFIFFGINVLFAGVILLFWQITKSKIVLVNNMTVYFNFSILTLILATTVSYIIVCVIALILDKSANKNLGYKIKVRYKSLDFVFDGISDTGNRLVDSFTGKPIIVCTNKILNEMMDINLLEVGDIEQYLHKMYDIKGLRLVPYSTIGNAGVIPAFIADSVIIECENMEVKKVDAYIGVAKNPLREDSAIFNPRLLI